MQNNSPARSMLRGCLLVSVLVLSIVGYSAQVLAVSASPDLVKQLRDSQQIDRIAERWAQARAKGVCSPNHSIYTSKDGLNKALRLDPETPDTFRVLVILCDFSDNPASGGVIFGQPSDFVHLLFSYDDEDNHYSMAEFYEDNSYGSFHMEGVVAGWYRLPQTYAYYVDGQNGFGNYPQNAQKMAEDAILMADPDVDFSQFDADGDSWVDGVFIVHAGPGAEQSGSDFMIWSHQWGLSSVFTLDGVNVYSYTAEPEEDLGFGLSTMGVYAHEYGHFLGLPDLYDTDYSSAGIGDWSLMSGGSWNSGGRRPAFMDPWCKKEVNFLTLTNVTTNMVDLELPVSQYNPVAYRLWESGTVGPQYFLIENRQKTGFDNAIDGSGLLIYHVDETVGGNWDENHKLVAVEQADGRFDLENDYNDGDGGDPWSAVTGHDFDDLSTPDTRKYDGTQTRAAVWGISHSDSVMYAGFDIEYSRPRLEIQSGVFSDSAFGNDNGIVEAGETITFVFTLQNLWLEATNVTGTLTADNNDIVFSTPAANIGTISGQGGVAGNQTIPIVFTVPTDFTPCIDSFFLEVTSDNPNSERVFGFELHVGDPPVLLVDDDGTDTHDEDMEMQLFNLRLPFDYYEKATSGSPSSALLNDYEIVIWITADPRPDIVSAADIAAMKDYLDNGGYLFLSGQGLVRELDTDDQGFLHNYLRATYDGDLLWPFMIGQPGTEIGDGLQVRYGGGVSQTDPQFMGTINGSVAEFDLDVGGTTMLSYDGNYRVVLASFGFSGLSDQYIPWGYAHPDTVLARILEFFSDDTISLNPTVTAISLSGETSDSNVVSHMPDFVWTIVDTTANPIVEYEVSLGTGNVCSDFENMWDPGPISGSDTSITYGGLPLDDGETYYFHVRVNNGVTWSEWSTAGFRMNSVAGPCYLYAPESDDQVLTSTPQLQATRPTDPEGDPLIYDFEIYFDAGLTQLVTSTSGVTPAGSFASWTVDPPLAEDSQFFWRVRAFDGYEYNEYPEAQSFFVNADNQPPQAFDLVEPTNGSTVSSVHPVLRWMGAVDSDAGDAVKYTLWTSTDPAFGSYTETVNIPDTFRALTYALELDEVYYWKVKATDKGDSSTWSSQTFSLTTPSSGCCQLRGNVNGDSGPNPINVLDVSYLVDYLFRGGPPPPCEEEGNVNGQDGPGGPIDITDITYLVAHLFVGGPVPPPC